MTIGSLEINHKQRQALLHGEPVTLTRSEYRLLVELASDPFKVFTKERLLHKVYRSSGGSLTLDSDAARLRSKLCAKGERFIINVWGVGYRLLDPPMREEKV